MIQQNYITSNLPNIYTIFNPDSETHLVELSDAVDQQIDTYSPSFQVEFKLTLDQIAYARSDYNILQFLGDVGALYDALYKIAYFILMNILKVNVLLDNKILKATFKTKMPNLELRKITVSYCSWLASVILCCVKRNKTRTTRKIHKVGLRRIERELDVAHFLRSQFTMQAMLKTLTDRSQRLQLRKNHRHVIKEDPGDTDTSTSSSDDIKPTKFELTNPRGTDAGLDVSATPLFLVTQRAVTKPEVELRNVSPPKNS